MRTLTLQKYVGLNSVSELLGVDQEKLILLVRTGEIRHAIDLRFPGTRRSLLRIWYPSALACLEKREDNSEFHDILNFILPPGEKLVPASRLNRLLTISHNHSMNLIHCGVLKVAKRGSKPKGRFSSPLLDRAALAAWLIERRFRA